MNTSLAHRALAPGGGTVSPAVARVPSRLTVAGPFLGAVPAGGGHLSPLLAGRSHQTESRQTQ